MHVKWAKSRARAEHWQEEVQLLCEEMCQVIAYFDWKAQWWTIQGPRRADAQHYVSEGAIAYAAKQANMFKSMEKSFAADWYPYLISNGLSVQWHVKYIPTQPLQSSMGMVVDE
jgi:hypothetical protein